MIHHAWSRLRHYLRVYQAFVGTSFSEAMSFRTHFVLLILMDLVFYVTALASVDILYDHVQSIGPWKREEFLFFTSFMLAINQLAMTFTSEAFWRFPEMLRTGGLDFILIKPLGSVFSVFFRIIRPGSACNVLFTGGALIHYGILVGLDWWDWCLLPFLVVGAFIFQNAMEMSISCGMFWMLEGTGINFLRMELQQLSRWPDFVYHLFLQRLLTLGIPVLLIGSAPVRFMFDPGDFGLLVLLVVGILVFWSILGAGWRAGLRAYESASS